MYGASVFPYQPTGIWQSPWNGAQWKQSKDGEQYRRALYTYWKRSAAYPSMLTFDGVSREVCTVRRIRTNTPLQALAALNDSVIIDVARHFARRMESAGADVNNQIGRGYLLATSREIDEPRKKALTKLYNTAYVKFKNDTGKTKLMNGGEGGAQRAALTVVANAILNLDEVLVKN
jgi:predicted solute-binding protein